MIRTATVENINRTGFGPLVVEDHVATAARHHRSQCSDSTTFERGSHTVRTVCATTNNAIWTHVSCTSVAAATVNSFLGAERIGCSGLLVSVQPGYGTRCDYASKCELTP
jgi:hypothetical protein